MKIKVPGGFALVAVILLSGCASSLNNQSTKHKYNAVLQFEYVVNNPKPVSDRLTIYVGNGKEITSKEIAQYAAATNAYYDSARFKKLYKVTKCPNGETCTFFDGKLQNETNVEDYYPQNVLLKTILDLDSNGFYRLHIKDGKREAFWKLAVPKKAQPIYLAIYLDDLFIQVTEFIEGKVIVSGCPIDLQTPNSQEFLQKNHFPNLNFELDQSRSDR